MVGIRVGVGITGRGSCRGKGRVSGRNKGRVSIVLGVCVEVGVGLG